ncbi:MAG: polyisoprenoid-binding protein [Siphonobacter aquaeclarae]|jgi:polyisoprenoid-binding protein YceI|nr:polyisoprenoid-binding protein [Siphonobacter aquaeclarae]
MKKLVLAAVLGLASHVSMGQAATWKVDNNHAKVGFTATHLMISDVDGYFKNVTASIVTDKPDFTDAKAEFTADVSNVSTGIEQRDNHLKSPDFFDAAQFPTLSFKSTSFTKTGNNRYEVKGDLTMHGVTKPVTLQAEVRGPIESPMGKKPTVGFRVSGTVNRLDFGIGAKFPETAVANEIVLRINAEFVKQP